MAANITDLVSRVTDSNTGRPIIGELASPGKAQGATSINIAAATNWTLETAIHFAIYETTTVGNLTVKDTTTQTDWKGTLSGTSIGNLTLTGGTDRAYTAGAIVEITPTARHAKDMYDWAMTGHNQNGTHKAFTESAIVPTAALQDGAVTKQKISFSTFGTTDANGWRDFGSYFAKSVTYSNTTNIAAHSTLSVSLATAFGSSPVNGPTLSNDNLMLFDRLTSDTSFSGMVSLVPASTYSVLWQNGRDGISQVGTRRITAMVFKV